MAFGEIIILIFLGASFNPWFLMHFLYLHIYAPPKPAKMDNYWMIIWYFWKKISKCPNLLDKMTSVLGYGLLPSPSYRQILFNRTFGTPCNTFFCIICQIWVIQFLPVPKNDCFCLKMTQKEPKMSCTHPKPEVFIFILFRYTKYMFVWGLFPYALQLFKKLHFF